MLWLFVVIHSKMKDMVDKMADKIKGAETPSADAKSEKSNTRTETKAPDPDEEKAEL